VESRNYRKYNRIIKEVNPIHMSKIYAQNIGYEDIVVAGNFLFTYIPKWIIDWVGDVNALKKTTVKFENPVFPDDEIVHKGKIVEIKEEKGKTIVKCDYHVEKTSGERTSLGNIILSI
jgi:acyl dehydratase